MKLRDAKKGIDKLGPTTRVRGDEQYLIECPSGHIIGSTKLSRSHSRELSPMIQGKICQQLHVRKSFWQDLVGCTKDKADYLKVRDHDSCP